MLRTIFRLAALSLVLTVSACTAKYIDSPLLDDELRVRNNYENRGIVELMETYEEALDALDLDALGSLVSEDYYENAGTTDTTRDDYGHDGVESMFATLAEHVDEMEVDVVIRDVVVDGADADVLFDYSVRMRYSLEGQAYWESERDVNRFQLRLEGGNWRIVSGL